MLATTTMPPPTPRPPLPRLEPAAAMEPPRLPHLEPAATMKPWILRRRRRNAKGRSRGGGIELRRGERSGDGGVEIRSRSGTRRRRRPSLELHRSDGSIVQTGASYGEWMFQNGVDSLSSNR